MESSNDIQADNKREQLMLFARHAIINGPASGIAPAKEAPQKQRVDDVSASHRHALLQTFMRFAICNS